MKALASNLHLPKYPFLRFLAALILMIVLAVSFVQLPTAYSAELAAPEKTMMFLKDVIKVDLTKYNATLASNWVDYPPHWGGLAQEDVTYDLDGGNGSKLYVTCKLREGMLHSCSLEVRKGSPIYAEPQSTNVLDVTQLFLERYHIYSGAEYITGMCNMLDRVDATEIETIKESNVCSSMLPPHSKVVIEDGVMRDIKTITVTEANVKLTITNIVDSYSVEQISFEWTYTVNGLDVTQNVVSITFEDGVFSFFRDDWNLFEIGSTSAISEEEAVNLARNAAEDYTLRIYLEGVLTDVEFNLADEPARAELFMYPRETLTVYPFWHIELYFDKFYYSAYGIQVGIWADTGEIESCKSLSGLGGPISEQDQTETSTEQNDDTASSTNIYIITVAAAIALVAAALLIHFRKTRKAATKPEAIMPEEST